MRPTCLLTVLLCTLAAACDGSRRAPVAPVPEVPDPPDGFLRFAEIAAGSYSACGLTADSLVYCWGRGHLAGEANAIRPVRVNVQPLGSIAVGMHHENRLRDMLCGTTASNEVICRGAAVDGEVTVPGSSDWRSLTVGGAICALDDEDDGGRCWNYTPLYGVLGSTMTEGVPVGTPLEIDGGREYYRIAAGSSTACAITWGHETWCWGYNLALQAGDAAAGDIVVAPRRVDFPAAFVEISVGDFHTCAVIIAGNTWCWGLNLHRQLGRSEVPTVDCPGVINALTGSPAPCTATPVEVEGNHTFIGIAAGGTHTCATDGSGFAYCWGTGAWGQIGNGKFGAGNWSATPQRVAGELLMRSIVAGEHFTCGIASNDATYCWGSNQNGALGIGADAGHVATVPHPIATPLEP